MTGFRPLCGVQPDVPLPLSDWRRSPGGIAIANRAMVSRREVVDAVVSA